jgi:hypothetical protein
VNWDGTDFKNQIIVSGYDDAKICDALLDDGQDRGIFRSSPRSCSVVGICPLGSLMWMPLGAISAQFIGLALSLR